MPSASEPHEYVEGDGNYYGCQVCGSRYHCAGCSMGSGMTGHSMNDKEGLFFSCQEKERAAQWVDNFLGRKKKS